MTDMKPREAKLARYLNEALAMEKELETALAAHVEMTTRAAYKRRLQQHVTETKRHGRELERRLKRLGGSVEPLPLPAALPDPVAKGVSAAAGVASRAVAAAKGPLHLARGAGDEERMLKNAKTEYSEEHREIATYAALEQLAESLGDDETAKLARSIKRDEERMAAFLERQLPVLTKAMAEAELPADERAARKRPTRSRGSGARGGSRTRASTGRGAAARARTTPASTSPASTSGAATARTRTTRAASSRPATSRASTSRAATPRAGTATARGGRRRQG